jgi:MFS family permease
MHGGTSGWAVFQSRDFQLFSAARFLSGLSRQAQNVAMGLFVYDVTQSAWALGLAGLFTFAPSLVFAFFTGHVADAYDRRLVATLAHAAAGLSAAGLFACAWFDIEAMWPVYALAALAGAGRVFGNPATHALVPSLVPRERFDSAVGWDQTISQAATISGPAIGGLLYALDAGLAFAAAAVAAAAAAALTAAIRARPENRPREKVSLATLMAGLTYVRAHPAILGAITLDFVAVLFGGVTALLPIFAQDVLGVGPWGVGLMRSMQALGALCTASLLAYWPLKERAGARLLQAVAVYGVAILAFGLSTDFLFSLVCMFVAGAADMVSVFIRLTLVQIDTPDAMRGRVSAVNTLLTGASNSLGEFESGAVAALIGAVPTVILGGAASILLAVVWAWLFPELRDRNRLIPEARESAATS